MACTVEEEEEGEHGEEDSSKYMICVPEVRDVGEKTLDQWVYFFLKLVENFKMAYLVGACEVFSSAVLSLDSVMPKQ